ncbi:MAG TPA: carbohydrate kinase family protein [Longilinea sp.]|nr:carbohydrate kinase family protein [Longilinea sp.]
MPEKRFDILVVGELNADIILNGDVTPSFGQVEKLVSDASLVLGSSSAIFACGAARLGLKVAFVSKVGQDTLGEYCIQVLKNHQIDTSGVVVDPGVKTGMSIILNRGVDRAILTYPGSMKEFTYLDINPVLIEHTRHLHMGGYYLLSSLQPQAVQLFGIARGKGVTTSLDTNYDPSDRWDIDLEPLLRVTDVFLPNETEVLKISREASVEAGLQKLSQQAGIVVVKQGAQGAIAQKGVHVHRAAGLSIQVVDTVGAGDTFDVGFLYGFLHHWEITKSLHMGCVCGSLSTRQAGGTAAQPTVNEALEFLQS